MKLWLDDKRDPSRFTSDTDWVWVVTAEEAIKFLTKGIVKVVSLDHDLGVEYSLINGFRVGNGYEVAKFIEENSYHKVIKPPKWFIHSQNTVGASVMKKALENADRYWKQ